MERDSVMRVAMLPLDIVEGEPDTNLRQIEQCLHALKTDTDLLVLPELFSTGFIKDKVAIGLLAEPLSGPVISRLKAIAAEMNIAIAGSFLCRADNGNTVNRAFFINPDDDCAVSYYDKHHLFSLSDESRFLTPGTDESPVIKFRGWNIALSICYDIRFPVWLRNTGLHYDMMIVPANWPDSRAYSWKHLLIGRALENQAVYIGTNRTGQDRFGTYSFLTTMGIDAKGTVVSEVHGNSPLRYASFNLDDLKKFREHFPVAIDADSFTLT